LSISKYISEYNSSRDVKIAKNKAYAEKHPYPADELSSLEDDSPFKQLFNENGERPLPQNVKTVHMGNAANLDKAFYNRLNRGSKGLRKLIRNENLLKIDPTAFLQTQYNAIASNREIMSIWKLDEVFDMDPDDFDEIGRYLPDSILYAHRIGNTVILQSALKELHSQDKKEETIVPSEEIESPINQEEEKEEASKLPNSAALNTKEPEKLETTESLNEVEAILVDLPEEKVTTETTPINVTVEEKPSGDTTPIDVTPDVKPKTKIDELTSSFKKDYGGLDKTSVINENQTVSNAKKVVGEDVFSNLTKQLNQLSGKTDGVNTADILNTTTSSGDISTTNIDASLTSSETLNTTSIDQTGGIDIPTMGASTINNNTQLTKIMDKVASNPKTQAILDNFKKSYGLNIPSPNDDKQITDAKRILGDKGFSNLNAQLNTLSGKASSMLPTSNLETGTTDNLGGLTLDDIPQSEVIKTDVEFSEKIQPTPVISKQPVASPTIDTPTIQTDNASAKNEIALSEPKQQSENTPISRSTQSSDSSALEKRLSRIEYILTNPLDVKIVS
jgi:hypothetical protein